MSEPGIDGGVVDDAELAALVGRTGVELRALAARAEDLGGQLLAVAALLDIVAARLTSPPSEGDDRGALAEALATDDHAAAMTLARRIAVAQLGRAAAPEWGLFG